MGLQAAAMLAVFPGEENNPGFKALRIVWTEEGEKLQKGGFFLERDSGDIGLADTLRRVAKVTVPCG
jgi:hypothetical protein